MNPERYHLVLASAGRPVKHGWWGRKETARRKFASWIGEYGNMPSARITFVDDTTGETLTSWPDEP